MFTSNYEPRVLNVSSHHAQQKSPSKENAYFLHWYTSIPTNGP